MTPAGELVLEHGDDEDHGPRCCMGCMGTARYHVDAGPGPLGGTRRCGNVCRTHLDLLRHWSMGTIVVTGPPLEARRKGTG